MKNITVRCARIYHIWVSVTVKPYQTIENIIYYIILAVVPRRSFDVYILRLFTHFRTSHKTRRYSHILYTREFETNELAMQRPGD